ncbi:hypothetical protein AE923_05115 [Xanthomonas arboricola]|nr:hypothetical protein AE923_05115 [Xanthomonas arboricola]KOB19392.1 hypothetical protein AE925_08025 [Xanthomonas arboricola]KOB32650.1 hypothetical protein AE928_06575 [Xanthomonas arboricola]KOB40493.1 hypothetical protein AE930_08130 [Xanthomonas arboricola]
MSTEPWAYQLVCSQIFQSDALAGSRRADKEHIRFALQRFEHRFDDTRSARLPLLGFFPSNRSKPSTWGQSVDCNHNFRRELIQSAILKFGWWVFKVNSRMKLSAFTRQLYSN